ncbi:MAG: FIST N-terminal domain-containing protein [Candidatus Thiodiazotropha sp.]|jgi:hypothetical protein
MYLTYTSAQNLVTELSTVQETGTLWLLCFSDQHADQLPPFFEAASHRELRFCGGIFPGLIDNDQRRDKGVIAIPLHPRAQLITGTLDQSSETWIAQNQTLMSDTPATALLFMDSQSPGISGFMEAIYDQFGTRVHFAGAGAGFRDLRQAPSIFCESGFIEHGSLLILLPQLSTVNVRHGWKRVAGPFIATRTNGKIIQELNWEAAGSFYRREIEALAPELKSKPVFPDLVMRFPLSIGKQAAEDVVRDPFSINDADEIVCLSDVPENSAIYISEGSKDSLIEAAQQAITECNKGDRASTCFISDCYSRALMLDDELATELHRAGSALKQITDKPLQGVLALGEICGNGHSSLEFYNKTFLVALLHE